MSGVMAAKAILGGIGGGMSGYAKGASTYSPGTSTANTSNTVDFSGAEKMGSIIRDSIDKAKQNKEAKAEPVVDKKAEPAEPVEEKKINDGVIKPKPAGIQAADYSEVFDFSKNKDNGGILGNVIGGKGKEAGGAGAGSAGASGAEAAGAASAASDLNLKDIYKDCPDSIVENFAKISAIDFHYKPEAQKEYAGEYGVDDKEHVGIKAQELEVNPATKGTVSDNENGDKVVNIEHLAFADTAAIAELSRRILALEAVVKSLMN